MEKVFGGWLVTLVAAALGAVAAAVVVADVTLGDSVWGKLLIVGVALSAIAFVGLRVASQARSVAGRLDSVRLGALDELLASLPDGAVRTELECQRSLIESGPTRTDSIDAVLERIGSRHPIVEIRSGEGRAGVSADVEAMVERLVWDATGSGAHRILLGWRLLGERMAIVVIDDGAHRSGPASLAAMTRLGLAGFDRRYEGGWVASSVEVPFSAPETGIRALPTAVMAR